MISASFLLRAPLEELIFRFEKGVGGGGTHETSKLRGQSETKSGSSQGLLVSNNQGVTPDVNPEPQSIISHNDEGATCVSLTLVFLKE
jgi:hypothetical protein